MPMERGTRAKGEPMLSSTKALTSLGVVAVMVVGGVTVAAVEGSDDPTVADETTTTEAVPSDDEPTTTGEPTTTEAPTTTEEPTTTAAPTTEAPATTVAPPEAAEANLYGQCTAFSGREQPGNSQAWLRLQERAGGDIEGFCAEVFAQRGGDDTASDDDGDVEQPEAPASVSGAPGGGRPDHAGPPAHAGGKGGNGRGR